jgi:hypothetical protein
MFFAQRGMARKIEMPLLIQRAGLADLVKANLGHGLYALPQANLPPTLAVV